MRIWPLGTLGTPTRFTFELVPEPARTALEAGIALGVTLLVLDAAWNRQRGRDAVVGAAGRGMRRLGRSQHFFLLCLCLFMAPLGLSARWVPLWATLPLAIIGSLLWGVLMIYWRLWALGRPRVPLRRVMPSAWAFWRGPRP